MIEVKLEIKGPSSLDDPQGPHARDLAMDPDALALAADRVLLKLGDVMADIIDQVHLELLPRTAKDRGENLACLVHEELAIAPGKIGCGTHRGNVVLTLGTVHGST